MFNKKKKTNTLLHKQLMRLWNHTLRQKIHVAVVGKKKQNRKHERGDVGVLGEE